MKKIISMLLVMSGIGYADTMDRYDSIGNFTTEGSNITLKGSVVIFEIDANSNLVMKVPMLDDSGSSFSPDPDQQWAEDETLSSTTASESPQTGFSNIFTVVSGTVYIVEANAAVQSTASSGASMSAYFYINGVLINKSTMDTDNADVFELTHFMEKFTTTSTTLTVELKYSRGAGATGSVSMKQMRILIREFI